MTGNANGKLDIEVPGTVRVPQFDERCYSSGPNAYLEEWVRENATPYDPKNDKYDVPDFTEQVPATKATAIYNMHSYHAGKKPHDFIRHYIRHYTRPADIVLDPMCGSGSTALAALMEGRKAIAIDISPAATFIAKNYCCPVDPVALKAAFEEVKQKVKPELDWLYETRCSRCGGKATTAYTVYSQVFKCPKCWEAVPLYDCESGEEETDDGKERKVSRCPHCDEPISTRSDEKTGAIPVAVSVTCLERKSAECKRARSEFRRYNDPDATRQRYFREYDLSKINEIESRPIPHWYPTDRMMHAPDDQERWGVKWRAGTSNFRTVDELFTKRNLWALAAISRAVKATADPSLRDALLFALTAVTLNCSNMYRYRTSMKGGFQQGTFYVPPVSQIINVLRAYQDKVADVLRASNRRVSHYSAVITTQSAAKVGQVPDSTVDYIFTDPPYGDRIQYGELNFIWESWLRFDTHWHDGEIIVNNVRGKSADDWNSMMMAVARECYRVLKPGRALSLCYHDTSEGTWAMVQDIMNDVGFIPEKTDAALVIDTGQKSYNQLVADSVLKRDLVLNFRKPRPGEKPIQISISFKGDETPQLFRDKVIEIIRAFLTRYPGSGKDVVFDAVISRLVQRGDMKPHDFEDILSSVAEPNDAGEWFLPNGEDQPIPQSELENEAEAAKAISEHIARVEADQDRIGATYDDILVFYLSGYRGRRPQRMLQDILPDWFYPAPGGGFRNPANDEERAAKEAGRQSGVNREIRRFLKHPGHAQAPSQQTLIQWLNHCLNAGLYEEGRELYERGVIDLSKLSEADRAAVEDDYEMCKLRLRRRAEQQETTKPKRQVRTKARPSSGQGDLGI